MRRMKDDLVRYHDKLTNVRADAGASGQVEILLEFETLRRAFGGNVHGRPTVATMLGLTAAEALGGPIS